jgi:hypothetical protein
LIIYDKSKLMLQKRGFVVDNKLVYAGIINCFLNYMNNKTLTIIVGVVLLLLFLIASVLAVILFTQMPKTSPVPSTTPTPTVSVGVTTESTEAPDTTVSATSEIGSTPTPPAGWDPIQNTKYGYTMYRPHSWYFRIFDGLEMIGINPSSIPVASDQPVAVEVYRMSNPGTEIPGIKSSLTPGYTDTTRTINGVSWEMITGFLSGGGILDDQYLKYGIFVHGSNTFAVKLSAPTADYAGHADEFETVITTLWFN